MMDSTNINLFLENINTYLENTNSKQLFIYFIVLLIIYKFFLTPSIIILCIFLYYFFKIKINKQEQIKNNIIPKLEHFDNIKDNNIIKYLNDTQYLYNYNPNAYQDMVNAIDNFFSIYNESYTMLSHQNYELLNKYKQEAINSLNSLIFNADGNILTNIKEETSKLQILMTNYIDDILLLIKKDNKLNGYNNKSKIINKFDEKVKPYSYYNNL
jgi:hypothetical protein